MEAKIIFSTIVALISFGLLCAGLVLENNTDLKVALGWSSTLALIAYLILRL